MTINKRDKNHPEFGGCGFIGAVVTQLVDVEKLMVHRVLVAFYAWWLVDGCIFFEGGLCSWKSTGWYMLMV